MDFFPRISPPKDIHDRYLSISRAGGRRVGVLRGSLSLLNGVSLEKVSWVDRADILKNPEWMNDWKVLMTRVQGTSAAVETMFLSRPIISGPGEACSETYLVAGRFDSEEKAGRYAIYLRTRFVRFLVSLRKATQDAAKDVYAFVPDIRLNREWTEEKLYTRYGLTKGEIAFIESMVRPMEASDE